MLWKYRYMIFITKFLLSPLKLSVFNKKCSYGSCEIRLTVVRIVNFNDKKLLYYLNWTFLYKKKKLDCLCPGVFIFAICAVIRKL